MLPLPKFRYHAPTSAADCVRLLAELGPSARVIAGGTDILPNIKHGIEEPEHLISIRRVKELRGIGLSNDGAWLVLGAGEALDVVAGHSLVRTHALALAEAAGQVGGPHHRAMGTIGGNVCLDTRCRFINQTHFWRKALGYCLKKDGTVCHVVQGGQNCVAAASNDTAPAMIALGAEIVLASTKGERTVKLEDLYTADGIFNMKRERDELVTAVRVPVVSGRRSGFEKLRRRGAIDFPLLSVGMVVTGEGAGAVELVVSALGAKPRRVRGAAAIDLQAPGAVDALAAAAFSECKPLANVDIDTAWRRHMVKRTVTRVAQRMFFTP